MSTPQRLEAALLLELVGGYSGRISSDARRWKLLRGRKVVKRGRVDDDNELYRRMVDAGESPLESRLAVALAAVTAACPDP